MNPAKKFSVLLLFFLCFQTASAGWTKQNSGTLAWLHAVYFADENNGWIAGSRGTLLSTEDGGKTWNQHRRFTEDNIRDLYFADENNGWLLCERSVYNPGSARISYLLKTADGGQTWEKVDFTEGRERIARIFFDKKGNGFAVGEGGAFLSMQADKKTWKKNSLPVRFLLLDGNFTDDLRGLLVGGSGTILFTEDAGASWHHATVAGGAKTKLNSVFFVNQKMGWAVGGQGKIYATMNGGRFWREQNSTVVKNLLDVFFINTAEGFAVGDEGTILRTTTGGNLWNVEETGVRHRLERVFFVGRKGFAVGFGGTILSYDTSFSPSKLRAQPQLQKRN